MGSQVPLKESFRTANCIISHTARRHRDDGNLTKHLGTDFCMGSRMGNDIGCWMEYCSNIVLKMWQCLNLLSVCRGKIMLKRSSVYAMSQAYEEFNSLNYQACLLFELL